MSCSWPIAATQYSSCAFANAITQDDGVLEKYDPRRSGSRPDAAARISNSERLATRWNVIGGACTDYRSTAAATCSRWAIPLARTGAPFSSWKPGAVSCICSSLNCYAQVAFYRSSKELRRFWNVILSLLPLLRHGNRYSTTTAAPAMQRLAEDAALKHQRLRQYGRLLTARSCIGGLSPDARWH